MRLGRQAKSFTTENTESTEFFRGSVLVLAL